MHIMHMCMDMHMCSMGGIKPYRVRLYIKECTSALARGIIKPTTATTTHVRAVRRWLAHSRWWLVRDRFGKIRYSVKYIKVSCFGLWLGHLRTPCHETRRREFS